MNLTKTNMATPGVHAMAIGDRSTPVQCDSASREEPIPILPKPQKLQQDVPPTKTLKVLPTTQQSIPHDVSIPSDSEDLVMSVDSITDSPAGDSNTCTEDDSMLDDEGDLVVAEDVMLCNNDANNGSKNGNQQTALDTGQARLPLVPEIQHNLSVNNEKLVMKLKQEAFQVQVPVKSPYKGVIVPCGKLKDYLDSLLTFNRKCMLRKGREVHKIYVDMVKGESFLDDQFSYTEFGKMVLTNGSIRAGRAKNAKQIVVARETLYCSGTASCKRACGGYGVCLPGCDKTKMRGHRCAYRIKLTQRLGYVNFWFVEELGSHDQIGGGKDCEFKSNSLIQGCIKPSAESHSSALDLSPKTHKASPERALKHSKIGVHSNGGPESVSRSPSEVGSDASPNYHYVLGLMPANSPSRESPSRSSESSQSDISASPSFSQQQLQQQLSSAIDIKKEITSQVAIASSNAMLMSLPSSHIMSSAMQNLPINVVNFMPELLSLGMNPLQAGFNQLLVNVKQEATEGGQGPLVLPMVAPGAQTQYSPSQLAKSHSPSPSRSLRDRSPLSRDQNSSVQKGLEMEAKLQNENFQKMQAKQNTLGQVHNRIMERARSRKSAQTPRVVQKKSPEKSLGSSLSSLQREEQKGAAGSTASETSSAMNLSIPKSSSTDSINLSEKFLASIPSLERFQTLNRIIQSDAFQAAKNQQEMKLGKGDQSNQDAALNLTVKQDGSPAYSMENGDLGDQNARQSSYFKLMEAWKNGNQSDTEACLQNGHTEDGEELDSSDVEELTDNEKELINRVRQLESHVKQLQNIVIKRDSDGTSSRRKKAQREFDFNKYNTRHVALKIMYLGCDYHGFAVQEDTDKTIEHALFDALKKTRLIESRETSNYHRCGRTDKGVSAFGQAISIDLRTNLTSGLGVKVREGGTAHERPGDKTVEIRYCQILNKVLPPEIRVLAWTPVDTEFSARFSCRQRTYKYIFPKANLDIPVMKKAAEKLVGENDYRNLCKMDVANGVTNFTRKILSTDITILNDEETGYAMCELTIVGSSFLWHQIRCIVALLFLVGQGKEKLEIIDELLDVEKHPKKPQYTMAHEVPLCLYESEFGDNFEWIYEADWHEDNIKHLQHLWAEHTVKATMLKRMLEDLDKAKVETECDIAPWSDLSPPVYNQVEWLIPGNKSRVHKPLMERPTCESLEERMEQLAKKRKLNTGVAQPTETSDITATEKE